MKFSLAAPVSHIISFIHEVSHGCIGMSFVWYIHGPQRDSIMDISDITIKNLIIDFVHKITTGQTDMKNINRHLHIHAPQRRNLVCKTFSLSILNGHSKVFFFFSFTLLHFI